MVLEVSRFRIFLTKDRLSVSSAWKHGVYKMSFPITRTNPLTYLRPIFWIIVRKLNPAYYFKKFPDQEWHICYFCGYVGNVFLEGTTFPACVGCKSKYD